MEIDRKIIFCDIDNTICETDGLDYENARPLRRIILNTNWLYDHGHTVVFYTARGAVQCKDYRDLTLRQLEAWGCRYSLLRMDKPFFDILIDDRTMRPDALVWKGQLPKFVRPYFPRPGDLVTR